MDKPRKVLALLLAIALPAISAQSGADGGPPPWAYPVNPPDYKPAADDGQARQVPGSAIRYPLARLRDRFHAPDWHPQDHPVMPRIVAEGRKPSVYACGFCHRADGSGGPENAAIAGLPKEYIVQQLQALKSGSRTSSVPQRGPVQLKLTLVRAISDEEIDEAATYFAALRPRPAITVIETDEVPQTTVEAWVLRTSGTGRREPIGQRIIEVPDDFDQFENRDARARFTAYVPTGSIARGEALIGGAGGKAPACANCHGPDLKGVGPIPPIVGRSPSYVVRQMYDVKHGARRGSNAEAMKAVVQNLSSEDMLAIAAALAARAP